MHDAFGDRLSEYLDGELLPPGERQALDAHLRECGSCRALLADLQQLTEQARSLAPRPPAGDLWDGIARRLSADAPPAVRRSRWRVTLTLPQVAAAGLLLAAVSGGAAWVLRAPAPATTAARRPAGQPPDAPAVEPIALADAEYDAAVADLEGALADGRGRLDPATVLIVERNLALIDQAIAQAREALATDPGNAYLNDHLLETRRYKLDLLRRASVLSAGLD